MTAADIRYLANRHRLAHQRTTDTAFLAPAVADAVWAFHRTFVQYRPTPLTTLATLARALGIAALWVKDESSRFGVDAFKVLGASYAIARVLAQRSGLAPAELSFERLRRLFAQARDPLTFVAATDGNHGRAVAWAAQALGQRAVIYLPRGSAPARIANVRAFGAHPQTWPGNYDEAVRYAAHMARHHGWILVQDTAWTGYEEIPRWVMQGYLTLYAEAFSQLQGERPTHVFIQAGVGAFAGALQGYLRERYEGDCPALFVVEPLRAACYYASGHAEDGHARAVAGALDTIMAGLAAGTPSTIGWALLRDYAEGFFACEDSVTIKGMRLLAHPLRGDPPVVSGESGAVTAGLATRLLEPGGAREIADAIGLTPSSKVLLFSTEGATDPQSYRRLVAASNAQ
jgi:diaminopropionate ammonia-lyase